MVFHRDTKFNGYLQEAEQTTLESLTCDGSLYFLKAQLEKDGKSWEDFIIEKALNLYKQKEGEKPQVNLNGDLHTITKSMLWEFDKSQKTKPQAKKYLSQEEKKEKIYRPLGRAINRVKTIYYGAAFIKFSSDTTKLFDPLQRLAIYDGIGRVKATNKQFVPKTINFNGEVIPTEDFIEGPIDEVLYGLANLAIDRDTTNTYKEFQKKYEKKITENLMNKALEIPHGEQETIEKKLQGPEAYYEIHRTEVGDREIMTQIPDPFQKDLLENKSSKVSKKVLRDYINQAYPIVNP